MSDNVTNLNDDLKIFYYSNAGLTTLIVFLILLCEYIMLCTLLVRHFAQHFARHFTRHFTRHFAMHFGLDFSISPIA